MLTEICRYLRNWFVREIHSGVYTIKGGSLETDFLQDTQYYRIVGSVFNDGVHIYKSYTLTDETFNGEVWGMAVPKEVIDLAKDIEKWVQTNQEAINSPFASESFGGYSYTFGSVSNASSGSTGKSGWQYQFAERLAPWRKI